MNAYLVAKSSQLKPNFSQNSGDSFVERFLLAGFAWSSFSIFCSLGNSLSYPFSNVGFFLSISILSILVASFLLALGIRSSKGIALLTFFLVCSLAATTFIAFEPRSLSALIFAALFLISLLVIPALLGLWSWWWQASMTSLFLAAMLLIWVHAESSLIRQAFILVFTFGLLAVAISYVRSGNLQNYTPFSWLTKSAQNDGFSSLLQEKTWQVMMLQAGLVLLLLFFDLVLFSPLPSSLTVLHAAALLVIIVTISLLMVAEEKKSVICVGASSVSVATILTSSLLGTPAVESFISPLPVVFIIFSTMLLPTPLIVQITIAWATLISGFIIPLSLKWDFEQALLPFIGEQIFLSRVYFGVIVIGVSFSILISYLLRQYRSKYYLSVGDFLHRDLPLTDEIEETSQQLLRTTYLSVVRDRVVRLQVGLLLFGILSCSISTLALMQTEYTLWPAALLGWVMFAFLWAGLLQLGRSLTDLNRLWFVGVVLALLLLFWPVANFVSMNSPPSYWIFWPISLVIGIGVIPWSLFELIPLVGSSIVISSEISSRLGAGGQGVWLFLLAAICSGLLSLSNGRRIREKFFLTNFCSLLSQCRDDRDCYRVLTDAMTNCIDGSFGVITGFGQRSELLSNGKVFAVSEDQSINALRRLVRDLSHDQSGIGLAVCNFLPEPARVLTKQAGAFSANHGVFISLSLQRGSGNESTVTSHGALYENTPHIQERDEVLIFLASRYPLVKSFYHTELGFIKGMAIMGLMRLETFLDRRRAAEQRLSLEGAQAEREYELSTLVHDINNTVQDLTLLCDVIVEDLQSNHQGQNNPGVVDISKFMTQVKRIAVIARSMAISVSDAKRRRELERLPDLTPRENVEANDVLREIVSFASVRAERRRISVNLLSLSNERVWVRIAAREYLETVIRNLLNNAIMYSDPGSNIQVRLRFDDKWVWIDIVDNGPGLSPEEQKAIFVSGYRGKSAVQKGGLGIGLSQSRRVAEAAGGRLEVFSAGAGQGSTFTISLPRQSEPVFAAIGGAWALVVDDQPTVTTYYSKIAKALQLDPAIASSVPDALNTIEKRGMPSFVLTDLHLGGSDGLDLVRALRARFGRELPILVVTGQSDNDLEAKVKEAGATDLVLKPVGRSTLFDKIRTMLSA